MPSAPSPNCGFTTSGPAGWVRLRLVNDDSGASWRDLWTVPCHFYPLAVAAYELDETVAHPDALVFNESTSLGGYTRSLGLDESPYAGLLPNVGLYACTDTSVELTDSARGDVSVVLVAGDFYAGCVVAIRSQPSYLFLVMV